MMAHARRLQLELLEWLAAAIKVVALQLPIGARHRHIVEALQQQAMSSSRRAGSAARAAVLLTLIVCFDSPDTPLSGPTEA